MQSSTPASSSGETPWLLFIGILAMALVPALSSFMRLRDFEDRLQGTEVQSAKAASDASMNRLQIDASKSHIHHLQRDSLPALSAQIKKFGTLEDKVAAAAVVQAEMQNTVEAADERARAFEALVKDLEGVDGRLAALDRQLGERLTKDEWEQIRSELVKVEEFKSIVSHLKEGQRVEIAKNCEAFMQPFMRLVEERLSKSGADQAAQAVELKKANEELKQANERLSAQAQQIVELMAKVDDLAKKAAEKPPEPK